MKIQIADGLNKEDIQKRLKHAKIVEDGDFILIAKNNRIAVYDDEALVFIEAHDIDYIESYDNTLFVYCDQSKYISTMKLYQFLDVADYLIRVSKHTVINKNMILEIRPSFNMKFEILINDKWLEVNRTYYYDFKETMGI